MARLIYGSTGGDVVAQISVVDGDYEPSTATFDVFTTRTGSTQHTSLLTMAGGAITTVTPDANGWIRFQGQDAYLGSYWLQDQANPSNPRWRIDPAGTPERVTALETGGGIGVTDGDKGDITVSGTGTVWNIDASVVGSTEIADNAVTLAKMADVATARILGRTTAATGDPEALTVTQVMTMLTASSATVSGIVELATDAEAITGTDTVRAVTPANLAAALASVPASTEAVQDIVGGSFFVAGNKITKAYDDTANTLTVAYAEPTPRTVTASATLALGDANAAIYDTAGSANVLTVPTNAAVAFPTDTQVDVWALGAGALTITASATVTLNGVSAGSYTPAQYSRTVLRKTGTNAWVASGGGSTVGTMATVIAGTILRCPWNGSAWTYAGTALVDRPSARTDIFFELTGAPYATADPAWMLTGDDRVDL